MYTAETCLEWRTGVPGTVVSPVPADMSSSNNDSSSSDGEGVGACGSWDQVQLAMATQHRHPAGRLRTSLHAYPGPTSPAKE